MPITKRFLIILFVLLSINLHSIKNINAPFVSQISYKVSNKKVLLNWENPIGFEENIKIFRSSEVIDSPDKLKSATKIAVLNYRNEKYVDTTPIYGSYYYAIIISDSSGEDYPVLIPYRNYTLKPAITKKIDYFEITKFLVTAKKNTIELDWNFKTDSKESIKIMLYRNTTPITDESALNSSIKIATLDIGNQIYNDNPISNISYYYAVFIEGDTNKKFIPDVNISLSPVSIEKRSKIFPAFSVDNFTPLPLLAIKNDPKTGKYFLDPQILKNPGKTEYNDNVKKIINTIRLNHNGVFNEYMRQTQKKNKLLEVKLLKDEEIFEPKEYAIEYKDAIKLINEKQYKGALYVFEEMAKEILPAELLTRISFYIGELYYAKTDYYISYVYFTLAYDSFRKEVQPYLDTIYAHVFPTLER